jgi:septum formation protein
LQFEVKVSNVVEEIDPNLTPYQNAMVLATNKAQAVAGQLTGEVKVLGGDTIVIIDDLCSGQPESAEAAIDMLQCLSGRWHEVCTGVALIEILEPAENQLRKTVEYEVSRVKMRQLTKLEIESYVNTGECKGVAGSYALQGAGVALIERMEGCITNVIGLPIPLVTKMLRKAGVIERL